MRLAFSEFQVQEYDDEDKEWVSVGGNIDTLQDAKDEMAMIRVLTDGKLRVVKVTTVIDDETGNAEDEVTYISGDKLKAARRKL